MARNTQVVKGAQTQLDEVTGGERLPEHSDVDELPYISAIMKEIFQWSPLASFGVPHRLMEDDIYTKGCLFPQGQRWWKVYLAPEVFNPDRFQDKGGKINPLVRGPEDRVFGSGRRWGISC